jgi:hypothetical protein
MGRTSGWAGHRRTVRPLPSTYRVAPHDAHMLPMMSLVKVPHITHRSRSVAVIGAPSASSRTWDERGEGRPRPQWSPPSSPQREPSHAPHGVNLTTSASGHGAHGRIAIPLGGRSTCRRDESLSSSALQRETLGTWRAGLERPATAVEINGNTDSRTSPSGGLSICCPVNASRGIPIASEKRRNPWTTDASVRA